MAAASDDAVPEQGREAEAGEAAVAADAIEGADSQDEAADLASLSESRQALAEAVPPVPVLEEVAVSKGDLIKQVAYCGPR